MEIELNPEYLILPNKGQGLRIRWDEIDRILVYKQDLFVYDRIAAVISFADDSKVELNEEMPGWKKLVDDLPRYLSNCRDFSDWFMDVAFPAFEPKPMLIFQRTVEMN